MCLVAQSCPILATPRTVARQAPLSMGFSKQEYWSGLPFPSPLVYIYLCIWTTYFIPHHGSKSHSLGTNVADFSLPIPPTLFKKKPILGPLLLDFKPSYFIHFSIPTAYQNIWHIVRAYCISEKLIKPFCSTLLASYAPLGKFCVKNSNKT